VIFLLVQQTTPTGTIMFQLLKFQNDNSKLNASTYNIHSFSLPAGHSCPAATECLAKAHRNNGTIWTGKQAKYRCFAASDEARSRNARDARWHNYAQLRDLKTREAMAHHINDSLPIRRGYIRIHVSGDFFNQLYFDAWMVVATLNPNIHFYAYTKSINYWMQSNIDIPSNMNLTASRGGAFDWMIDKFNLKSATVVFHPSEADKLGLEIDHDDSLAMLGTSSFALLLHGTQPAKSAASKALSRMRTEKIQFSYSRKA
jgi:hypothetical protein